MTTKEKEKNNTLINLSDFNTERLSREGIWMQLLSIKDGSPLPARIKLGGTDTKEYKQLERKRRDRRLNNQATGGFRNQKIKTAELEHDIIEGFANLTFDWENISMDGKTLLECTPENIRRLYSEPGYSWIVEQIDRFVGDRANFIKS